METSEHAPPSGFRPASRQRTPSAYRICDGITESALYFMIVFAPWSFGTTERWSIWTMNIAGYALGALLLVKRWVGWRAGYRPARWGSQRPEDGGLTPEPRAQRPEARSQKPEARSQNPDARSQSPEARSQKPEARSQKPEARSCYSYMKLETWIGESPFWLLSSLASGFFFLTISSSAICPFSFLL